MPKSKEPPLPEKIAASLVQKINTGALKPGDRVLEQAIADEFATSRGPVRDAFKIYKHAIGLTSPLVKGHVWRTLMHPPHLKQCL